MVDTPPANTSNINSSLSKIKIQLSQFDGSDDGWDSFIFKLKAIMAMDGFTDLTSLNDAQSQQLYWMIAAHVNGPAVTIIRSVQEGNGVEALKKLKDRYESSRPAKKFETLNLLFSTKWDSESNIPFDDHIALMCDIRRKLDELKEPISTTMSIATLLHSVPESYQQAATIIKLQPGSTISNIENFLKEYHDSNKLSKFNYVKNEVALNVNESPTVKNDEDWKKNATCFRCGYKGHIGPDCKRSKGHKCTKCNGYNHFETVCKKEIQNE